MRWLLRGLGALLLLLAVAVGAGLFWVSHSLDSPALRQRIDRDAERLLGRRVGFEKLSFDLLPPALAIVGPYVEAGSPEEPRFLEAARVSVRVDPRPLLERRLVIPLLTVEGARVRLVRTALGLDLPWPEGTSGSEGAGLPVVVDRIRFEDASLHVVDRLFSPPLEWDLEEVDAELRAPEGPEGPLEVQMRASSQGGRLAVSGTVSAGSQTELEVELERFPLEPLRQVLPKRFSVAGRATGTIVSRGPPGAPDDLELALALSEAAGHFGDFAVAGELELRGDLQGSLTAPSGRFAVVASNAALRWGGVFSKPRGVALEASGKYAKPEQAPLELEGELEMHSTPYAMQVRFGSRVRVRLRAGNFELASWHPLLDVFSEAELTGPVLAENVEILSAPFELRGSARLAGVELTVPNGGRLSLSGRIDADGDSLRSQDLVVSGASGEVSLAAELGDLGKRWTFHVKGGGKGVDSNSLLTRVAGRPDLLYGPLDFEADLRGELAAATSFREQLAGRVALRIAPGRLRGFSIFEAAFRNHDDARASELFGKLKLPSLKTPLSTSLERFYGDRFDSLSATLDIQRGVARTSDFQLVTPFYGFDMQGSIRVEDLGLDASGKLNLGREVVSTITGSAHLPGMLPGLELPLPAIRGTLTNPQTEADWGFFWRTLLGNVPGVRLLRNLGKKVPTF